MIDGQEIRAWGFAKAPSGRGFNMILTSRGKSDIYGHWITLHVRHNPISTKRDHRPEPFPFSFAELPEEINHLNVIHIYQSAKGEFEPKFLELLISELF